MSALAWSEMDLTKQGKQPTKVEFDTIRSTIITANQQEIESGQEGAEELAYNNKCLELLKDFDPQAQHPELTAEERAGLMIVYAGLAAKFQTQRNLEYAIAFNLAAYQISDGEQLIHIICGTCQDAMQSRPNAVLMKLIIGTLKIVYEDTKNPNVATLLVSASKSAIDLSSDAFLALGLMLIKDGKIVEAVEVYKTAYELTPDGIGTKQSYAEALNILGLSASKIQKWDKAAESFKEAIKVWCDVPNAKGNLVTTLTNHGITLAMKGEFVEGISKLQEAKRIAPNDEFATSQLAAIAKSYGIKLVQAQQFQEGIKYLKIASAVDPKIKSELELAHSMYANKSYLDMDYKKALEEYNKVLELNPDNRKIKDTIAKAAVTLQNKGKEYFEIASEYFDTAYLHEALDANHTKLFSSLLVELALRKSLTDEESKLPMEEIIKLLPEKFKAIGELQQKDALDQDTIKIMVEVTELLVKASKIDPTSKHIKDVLQIVDLCKIDFASLSVNEERADKATDAMKALDLAENTTDGALKLAGDDGAAAAEGVE